MAGGQPLRLGPFVGALNTASDPTAIADAELVELNNFELDIDGSLISRTPLQELQGYQTWTERIVCIGTGIFGANHYVIGSNSNGVFHYLNGVWTVITTTFQASVAVQYANTIYLVPKPGSGNGGKWDPVGGFTAVAAIPKGQAAVIHKERLYICPGIDSTSNTSRLSFSDPGNFEVWGVSSFIDIGQGDGTKLIDITVFQDNLLLFKNQSTYVLSYDVRPADAVVRKISLTIGVDKQFCVANYENQVYVFHGGWVYEIINYDFNRLNTKVPFERDETAPSPFSENIFLSILEDRLVCRFYRSVYVYGLRTRTWSTWESESDPLQYFGPITTIRPPGGNQFYAGSCVSLETNVIKFLNTHTSTDKERAFRDTVVATDDFAEIEVNTWGTSDQGLVWTLDGGVIADYSKNGALGKQISSTVNVFRENTIPVNLLDVNQKITLESNKLAVGANQIADLEARHVFGTGTFYFARVTFTTAAVVNISIQRRIAGVNTSIVNINTALTHVANTRYGVRFVVQGSQLKARIWLNANPEPTTWDLTTTDTNIVVSGSTGPRSVISTGASNAPVIFSFDSYEVIDLSLLDYTISCYTKTKNFDMAVSHQFKRLWWWGVDISTPNDIIGTATPIIVTFSVKWRQLETRTWRSLENNKWGQILSDPSSIVTVIAGAGGLSRKFAKFDKALRYRQINFRVDLTTDGSTSDGPARLFSMTVVTESKQVVPKAVN